MTCSFSVLFNVLYLLSRLAFFARPAPGNPPSFYFNAFRTSSGSILIPGPIVVDSAMLRR
jgi:hypothetical protein